MLHGAHTAVVMGMVVHMGVIMRKSLQHRETLVEAVAGGHCQYPARFRDACMSNGSLTM